MSSCLLDHHNALVRKFSPADTEPAVISVSSVRREHLISLTAPTAAVGGVPTFAGLLRGDDPLHPILFGACAITSQRSSPFGTGVIYSGR
jgi:hypothetical protein